MRDTAPVLKVTHRTTPLAWCSPIACLAAAALLLAGCGGSTPAHKHRRKRPHVKAPTLVNADVIAKSARLSAAQKGYAVKLELRLDVQQLGGTASASAHGGFDSAGGELQATVYLPGLLALITPLTTPVIVTDGDRLREGSASIAADELSGVKPWLSGQA